MTNTIVNLRNLRTFVDVEDAVLPIISTKHLVDPISYIITVEGRVYSVPKILDPTGLSILDRGYESVLDYAVKHSYPMFILADTLYETPKN